MARAREPRFLGSARRPRMHTQGACTGSNVYTCVREGPCSERLVGPRAHTVPTTARSPFSVLMAAHKPSGVRGVRGPCRAHSTQGSDGGSGRRAAHRWARCVHGSRAPRSACTRAALSTQPTRSAGAGRQATWFPGEKCGTPRCSPTSLLRWVERRQRQRREPRGECGVHNTRACVHIRHGESGCGPYRRKRSQPTPAGGEFEKFRFRNGNVATDPRPPGHS